jgi:hypothetical protein
MAVDSETWKTQEFGHKECDVVSHPIKGECKWCGGALGPDNRTIFCIPSHATTILAIDTLELTVEEFGNLPEGGTKWSGVAVSPDGKTLFGIPLNSESVVSLDMETRDIQFFGHLEGKRKWKGGVLAPDGIIYGIPAGHPCVLQIDTARRIATTITGGFPGENLWPGWKWSGGVLHPASGTIFCMPTNSHKILAIGPIADPASDEDDGLAVLASFYSTSDSSMFRTQSSQKGLDRSGSSMSPHGCSGTRSSPKKVGLEKVSLSAGLAKPRNLQQDRRPLFEACRQQKGEVRKMSQSFSLPRLLVTETRHGTSGGGIPPRSRSATVLPSMNTAGAGPGSGRQYGY